MIHLVCNDSGGIGLKMKSMAFYKIWRCLYFFFPPVSVFLLITSVLEFCVREGWIKNYILPAPTSVFGVFFTEWDLLRVAAWSTFQGVLGGFGLSMIFGISIALFLDFFPWIQRAFYPYALFFQTVPIISIAPLLVVWLGFGQPIVIAASCIVSLFPVIVNTLLGLKSIPAEWLELFQFYEASRLAQMFQLKMPAAMPQVFAGLRIAAGLASVGATVGEFVTGGGLGGVIDASRSQQRLDLVFAAVLMSSFLGLALVGVVQGVSWLVLRKWHPTQKAGSM